MRTLTLVNKKGGVAKTTSTLNIAAELAERGLRVLCVDADPQATLSLIAGFPSGELDPATTTLTALLEPEFDPELLLRAAPWGGGIIPSHPDLVGAELALADAVGPHVRLRHALARVADRFDVALIDSPPATSKLMFNAMIAADALLLPVIADYPSVGGLAGQFATIELVRHYEQPELRVLGVFATLVRPTRHCRDTLEQLVEMLGDDLIPVAIPQNVDIQDAQAGHRAVRQYRPQSSGAAAYERLVDEIVVRAGIEVR